MPVFIRNYTENQETKYVAVQSIDKYAIVFRTDKGKLKDAYVFDGRGELAAKYVIKGDKMKAETYGENTFGGALSSKKEVDFGSSDHSHLYLKTMNGGSPFDMSWEPDGRLSLAFGIDETKTVGDLHLDWKGKVKPQVENRYQREDIFEQNQPTKSFMHRHDLWVRKVEELTAQKGMAKRLNEITLEKKAEVLDKEVEREKAENLIEWEEFKDQGFENPAERKKCQKNVSKEAKDAIIAIKASEIEKKRFEKYKKMSAQKLNDPDVQRKLAEMRAKKEGR